MLTIMSTVFFVVSIFAFIAIIVLVFVGMVRKKPNPDTRAWQQKTRSWILGAAILWAVTLIISVAIPREVDADAEDPAESDVSAYTQTWEEPYSSTTCSDWDLQMTDRQKFAASADILAAAWGKVEESDKFPQDSLISEFQRAVSTACVIDDMTITEVSFGVYATEPRFKP